ncbi:MAG: hypothetical protein M1423_09925 [Acidobacteria bacterium]|nr:hypothetical protein [Acidobacteriota bacterium]
MSAANSQVEARSFGAVRVVSPVVRAGEILAVYAIILFYIWRWQDTHPYFVIPLLAVVLFSHWVHHDHPKEMGLTRWEFRPSARLSLPVLVVVILSAIAYAVWNHDSARRLSSLHVWLPFSDSFLCADLPPVPRNANKLRN